MKKLLFVLAVLGLAPLAHANFTLKCWGLGTDETDSDVTLGVVRLAGQSSNLVGPIYCEDQKGFNYDLKIVGAGLGLSFITNNDFIVECPLVRRKKVQQKGLKLFGPSASANLDKKYS